MRERISTILESENFKMIKHAFSSLKDAKLAVREIANEIYDEATAFVVIFCSPAYSRKNVEAALGEAFSVLTIGCTTAGEIIPGGYEEGGMVGIAFHSKAFSCESIILENVSTLSMQEGAETVHDLNKQLEASCHSSPDDTFALLFIDGLSNVEDRITAMVMSELGNIPLIGGSAAGTWELKETFVIHEGRFLKDAAVLTLVSSKLPFEATSTHHFKARSCKAVITDADVESRVVTEINGAPALEEYARLYNRTPDDIDINFLSMHPLLALVGGKYYPRGILDVYEGKDLLFASAIDVGVVLTTSEPGNAVENLDKMFSNINSKIGPVLICLSIECAFRRLENIAYQKGFEIAQVFGENNVVGFSAFGEQIGAVHANHSFTCVAFGQNIENLDGQNSEHE